MEVEVWRQGQQHVTSQVTAQLTPLLNDAAIDTASDSNTALQAIGPRGNTSRTMQLHAEPTSMPILYP